MAIRITERITKILEYKGLTQVELGEMIGVSGATVGYWCNGKREPTRKNLAKLALLLKDVRESWIIEGIEPMLKSKENFASDSQESYGGNDNFIKTPQTIKLENMAAQIESLKKDIASKEELLKAKDEIIELLKKNK